MIETAKDHHLFFTKEECEKLGERILIRSGESVVYENSSQGIVYKIRDPFAKRHLKSNNLQDVLYEHIAHNLLFPEAKYTFIGMTEVRGDLRLIYSQKLIFTTRKPSQKQIDNYLISIGLLPENFYYFGNEYLAVIDVDETGDNVLLTEDGQLVFIDPVIKLKKPIDEIISAFPFKSVPVKKPNLLDRLKHLFKL